MFNGILCIFCTLGGYKMQLVYSRNKKNAHSLQHSINTFFDFYKTVKHQHINNSMECWPITIMTWKNTWLWIIYWWKMRCVGKEYDTPWKPFLQFHQYCKYHFWKKIYVSTRSTILQCLIAVITFQRKFCLNWQA